LHLDGIVASVEDEQGSGVLPGQPPQQTAYLLGGEEVSILLRTHPPGIGGGDPGVAREAELGHELVCPPGDNRLTGGVAARMVVVSSAGTGLRIAARPGASVNRVDAGAARIVRESLAAEQVPQLLFVDPPVSQGSVEATPPAVVCRREAEVDDGRNRTGAQDGVAELEQGVGPGPEAAVEPLAERP